MRTAVLTAAVLAASSALAAPKPGPHKTPPAAKPATAAATDAAPGGPFDAREPGNLIALLATLDAKGQVTAHDREGVLIRVTSPAGGFTVQYEGCNQQGHVCSAVQFDASAEAKTATIAEINGFNQSSLACRIFQDKAGKPHVLYSSLVFASSSRQDMLTHINAWRGCLADFGGFLKDPPGYLAAAP
ncbi:MAG TPA: YbjN domain-containing protein [Phenylobacterium sp.]|nr:YbjN domain-containing protein [Phenylobacterium sp.]